jgi:ribosomal protein S24E
LQNSSDAAVEKALANGIDTDKDLVVEDQIADSNGAAEVESVVKVYFVRLPRPQLDDAHLKKLQAEFQSHVADIKGINARLAAKRVRIGD